MEYWLTILYHKKCFLFSCLSFVLKFCLKAFYVLKTPRFSLWWKCVCCVTAWCTLVGGIQYSTAYHNPRLYTSSLFFYLWLNLFFLISSVLLMHWLSEELSSSTVGWYFRSRKRNTTQWRNPHHYPHHRSSERHEAVSAESKGDSASVPQRVGGTGTSIGVSLRQPKLSSDMSPALVAQTNWSFVEKLLKVSRPSSVICEAVSTSYLASLVQFCYNTIHMNVLRSFRVAIVAVWL